MEIHILQSTDIYLNLAMEEALLSGLRPKEGRLAVWKNRPAVVMGRFQNPWAECDLRLMKRRSVQLARRQSGGGTVYHDLGNLNISFMDWNHSYNKDKNNEILVQTLKELGHNAITSGRSDIQVIRPGGNKKVSGAAFKKKKDRSFHHCTMLLDADLKLLNSYLSPRFEQDQVKTKAIASVRSKVANIKVSEEKFIQTLAQKYGQAKGGQPEIVRWSEEEIRAKIEKKPAYLEKLRSWKWIYGETPLFETTLIKGEWSVDISAKKGVIREIELNHDELHPSFLEGVQKQLQDCELRFGEIETALNAVDGAALYGLQLRELKLIFDEFFTPA